MWSNRNKESFQEFHHKSDVALSTVFQTKPKISGYCLTVPVNLDIFSKV